MNEPPWRCVRIPFAEQRVVPWRNGGGSTREVAIEPAGATVGNGFVWRISVASVAADGPFSAFPGVDRCLWLVRGAGMVLEVGGAAPARVVLDHPGQRYDFAGETPIVARLLDGPNEDLNVMVARDRAVARAGWHELAPDSVWHAELPPGEHVLLLVRGGVLAAATAALERGDALRVDGAGRLALRATAAPCTFLLASFTRR